MNKKVQNSFWVVLCVGVLCSLSGLSFAASGGDWEMEPSPDLENLPSLQNGMQLYTNYCIGCHALQFQRYERTADDLGIPHDVAVDTVIHTGQKIGGLMVTAMDPDQAKNWFGAPPPDLTMVARVRSPEWIYNYLKAFYLDDSRPFGVNNAVFENVGMPHALLELQGVQKKGCIQVPEIDPETGGERRDKLQQGVTITKESCGELYVEEGTGLYTAEQYDEAVYDIVNFLYYVGEPSRLERQRTGVYVLLFLVILGVFTYLLNREYWRDVR